MTHIPGIHTENDIKGNLKKITIDVKKHPQAIGVLKEAGIIPKTPFEIEFEENFKNGKSVEEVFKNVREKINKYPK